MKNIPALLLILLFTIPCFAQGVFRNQTSSALEKVVQDYPRQFNNIKGELISSSKNASAYKSNIIIPGAISTSITQSVIEKKEVVSWETVIFENSEFGIAKNRFEELFNQIKNTIIKPEGEKMVIVNGVYMNPSVGKISNAIQFDLMPASGTMQKLNIDLVLENTGKQWKIVLNVYDKDRKETEMVTAR